MPTPTDGSAATSDLCQCRPACLSHLEASDVTVTTPAGVVLAAHLTSRVYPDVPCGVVSPLSKRATA